MKKLLFLALIAAFNNLSLAAPVEDHFYVDGVYMFNVVSRASTTDFDFNEANGLAAFAGYRFNSYFSIELGGIKFNPIKSLEYSANGNSTISEYNITTEYDVAGYSFGVRGEAPVGDLFTTWIGIGMFSWDSTFNYDITYPNFPAISQSGSNSNSGEDYYLRLGVTHPISDSIHITIETMQMKFSDFFNTDQNNTDFRQDYIGVGIGVNF